MVIRRSDTDKGNASEENQVGPCVETLEKDTYVSYFENFKDTDNPDNCKASVRYDIIKIRDAE